MGQLKLGFLVLMLTFCAPAKAQDTLETELVLEFFDAIYSYNFTAAREVLDHLKAEHRGQPQTHICEANYYWWLMVTGMEDDSTREGFDKANHQVIHDYSNRDPASMSSAEIFSVIHGYAYQTRYALHNKKFLQGISNLNKIMPYLKIVLDNPLDNPKYRFLAGLYHYLAAVTIEERPLLRPFFQFAPNSDKALGYDLLTQAAKSDDALIQTEASYFLMKINLEIASNPAEAIKWSKLLVNTYPQNILYHYYLLNSYVERGLKFSSQQAFAEIKKLSSSIAGLTRLQREHFQKEGQIVLKKLH